MTASRRAVAAAVARQRGHFTAEALAAALPNVGRATVYRTLKILTEAGVLCRVLMDDGSLHYRLSGPGHHHHLVCVGCGAIQDFADSVVERVVSQLARAGSFTVEGHWLEVYGRCAGCSTAPSAAR
ncbi:MAG: transcriptional repressor [Chloroflexi bacterium]|nr:transcriptional repressor [Chloroflexota bacterium]